VERNLYWVTDGTYQSAFLTTSDGVVLKNIVSTVKTAKAFGMPIVHSTVQVASGRGKPTVHELAELKE
jgi:hypothetical protein